MIDSVVTRGRDPSADGELEKALSEHARQTIATARRGDRRAVEEIESAIQKNPASSFEFDPLGFGTLRAGGRQVQTGRFEVPSIAELRQKVQAGGAAGGSGRIRLWVLDGASPATDIGALQATAGPGTLFQVASQFNCLESPGPYVTPVSEYFHDPTQGPRASISAYPGTFLRHYAAPGRDGRRFVQETQGAQLNLLEAVCADGVARVRSGYLTSSDIADPRAFADLLPRRFDEIRIGVHDQVPVLLGYNWDGGVEGDPRIGQVFTSTYAAGGYSRSGDRETVEAICRSLLRAAYLGTLLAAASLDRPRVVLTLIGGGVFGNPIPLIWDSILWAIAETEPLLVRDMDVVVNGRNLGERIAANELIQSTRERGGALIAFATEGAKVWR